MADAVILLGSNIDPATNIALAVAALRKLEHATVSACSRTFVTPAIGSDGKPSGQADFHNAALRLTTRLSLAQLRVVLRTIEAELGRVRTADKFAPRVIDLDIVLYAGGAGDLEETQFQDPDLTRFPHVAVPAAEVAPNWILPADAESLTTVAHRLATNETEMMVR